MGYPACKWDKTRREARLQNGFAPPESRTDPGQITLVVILRDQEVRVVNPLFLHRLDEPRVSYLPHM